MENSAAKQTGKGGDDHDYRESDPQSCEGHVAHLGQMPDVDSVHHVIEKLYHLSHGERNGLSDDLPFH